MSSSSPTGSNPVSTLTQDDYKLIQKHSEVRQKIGKLEEKEKKVSTIWFTLFHKDDLVNLKTEDSRIETTLKNLHLDQETIQNIQTIYDLDQKIQKTVNSKWYQWFEFGKKDIEKHISSLEKIAHTANEHEFQALTFATSKLDPQKTGLSDNFSLSKLIRITETFEKLKPGPISAEFSKLKRFPNRIIELELDGKTIAISEPYASKKDEPIVTIHDLAQKTDCLTQMEGSSHVSSASSIEFQDGRMFATMENMEGEQLRTKLAATDPPLTPSQKISILSDIAKGLQELRNKDFSIERLSLNSVLVDKDNKAVIADLSSVKRVRKGHTYKEELLKFLNMVHDILKKEIEDVSPESFNLELIALLNKHSKADSKSTFSDIGNDLDLILDLAVKDNEATLKPLLDAPLNEKIFSASEATHFNIGASFSSFQDSSITYKTDLSNSLIDEALREEGRPLSEKTAKLNPQYDYWSIDKSSGRILGVYSEEFSFPNSSCIILNRSHRPDELFHLVLADPSISERAIKNLKQSLQSFNKEFVLKSALTIKKNLTDFLASKDWQTMNAAPLDKTDTKAEEKPRLDPYLENHLLLSKEIEKKTNYQATVRWLLAPTKHLSLDSELESNLATLRKFDAEITEEIKKLELALEENLVTISGTPAGSKPSPMRLVLATYIPPTWTKETVKTILRGSAGVNDDTENFDSTTMRSSLIKNASRSLNIYHQKEGEAQTPISIVDNLSTEDSDIERGEKTNIKSLYDKIGEPRMRKIDLLLSHGSDAIKFKDLPYESIASAYPELDMLPTRFSGEGQRFTKITETATHIIIEQEILLKLSDNPRDDDSFKSCYLNTISRTSIPIAELDSEDFLTRTGDKSGIKASMTFFRPCLTKEAAIACCPTEQSLRHPLKT